MATKIKKITSQEEYEYELYSPGEGQTKRLRRCGYKNVQKEINEMAVGIGLEHYIEVDAHGNTKAVINNKREGYYGDFTQVPETMAEARKNLTTAKETLKWIEEETLRQEGAAAEKKKAEALKTGETKPKAEGKKPIAAEGDK